MIKTTEIILNNYNQYEYNKPCLNKVKTVKEGDVFKNRKELCEFLNMEYYQTGGNKIEKQIKVLQTLFEYEKKGQSFTILKNNFIDNKESTIIKLYEVISARKGASNFLIDLKHEDCTGIYKLYNKDYIYIGMTQAGFRKRYEKHTYENRGCI